MSAAAILLHVLGIAHGLGASLACACVFYLGGLVLLPHRVGDSLGRGASPAMSGAALYVLLCWFGIGFDVPLAHLTIGFGAAVLVLAVVRYRWLVGAFEAHTFSRRIMAGWLLAFAALYVLAYLFTMPPVTGEFLPVAWTGNVDLLTYIRYTRYLMGLGPSNVVGFSYLNFVYLQTPAVFYLLGALSAFFGQDPLSAAMPAQFALTALIGIFAARISRSVFAVSRGAAFAIACILVSGPFFRYVAGAYFLSTLMSTPVLLYLVWTTVRHRSQRWLDVGLTIRFGSAYVLLLFLYPFLLFAGLGAQVAVIGLTWVAESRSDSAGRSAWRDALRHAGRTTCAVLVPLGLLTVGLYQRVAWSVNMVRGLSQKGVAGWPLDLISPLAILGLPGTIDGIQVTGALSRALAFVAFLAVASVLGLLYFWRFRRTTTSAERTLVGLAAGSFVAYCAYFLNLGPSYQQWKFASYTALPLSFVVIAGGLRLLRESAAFVHLTQTRGGQQRVMTVLKIVAVGLVGGNLLAHTLREPGLMRFSGAMRNISTIDAMPSFREMTIWMSEVSNDFPTWLTLYFLPTKRVHVISSHFSPNEPLSFDVVSRQRPLLIQNFGCEGVGHDDTITVPGVGCLLLGPPTLAPDTPYPFSRTYLFVDIEGMTARGPWGRFNDGRTVLLRLTADPRRTRIDQDGHLNLLLSPYLRLGVKRQRLVLSWGTQARAEVSLSEREWISLPVRGLDWTGNWVRTLTLSIGLPDAAPPQPGGNATGSQSEDPRPLAVAFEELSFSTQPAGRQITVSDGAAQSCGPYGADCTAVSPGGRRSKEISPTITPS